ncbi:hypothetical protein C493_19281 [Natronolimnohabitans innermongolicus JCM 12255]|uniref:Uncharacterized protein n=1 Tax=Natronolimnohabitans innermongolicus JCM 12255 TaxID=1227499 RepID=L9WLQ5_9EURY|nr:hypothetical protein C493_19281 [Natronolimnohabitans innermongolicus JCM 12255]
MEINDFLNGDQLTGRQAATIFFLWLAIVLAAGIILLLFTSATIS